MERMLLALLSLHLLGKGTKFEKDMLLESFELLGLKHLVPQ